MPLVYRAMTPDGEKPLIAPSARGLGVRPGHDIEVSSEGYVEPLNGGMSVAPSWRELKRHRIPRRLRHLAPGATGSTKYRCWRMGDGPFLPGSIGERLYLRPDRPAHGTIEPSSKMLLDEFQAALAATCDEWVIDEA